MTICARPACETETLTDNAFCSWDCRVEMNRELGAKEVRPNGLRAVVIRADGTLLEHEAADHPDYKFPVMAEFVGTKDPEALDHEYQPERHALIYTDGYVAVTLFECCYALWHLNDGFVAGGYLWESKEWKLTDEAREAIKGLKAA